MADNNDGSWRSLLSWANLARQNPKTNAHKARGNWGKFRKNVFGWKYRTDATLKKRKDARSLIYKLYREQTGAAKVNKAQENQGRSKEEALQDVTELQTHMRQQHAENSWQTDVYDQYGPKKKQVWNKDAEESQKTRQIHAQGGTFTYQTPVNKGGRQGDGGRLSVAANPNSFVQLSKNLHDILAQGKARSGKVTSPGNLVDRTDSAVLYLQGNESAQDKKQEIAQSLVHDVDVFNEAPGGMGRVVPGVFTSETPNYTRKENDPTAHEQTSHGVARSMIIEKAIRSTHKHYGADHTEEQFQAVLKYKLERHGLDPNQPSTRLQNRRDKVPKPWEDK